MQNKRLIVIVGGAVLAAAVAYLVAQSRAPSTSMGAQEPVVKGLAQRVNDIERIVATGAGDETLVTLAKGASAWTVAERDGYPADPAKVRKFLLELADAARVERKTARADNYPELGVEDVSAPTAAGIRIELQGLDQPVSMIVGKSARGGKAAYVRVGDDPVTWVANRRIAFEKSPVGWLDKELIDINAARVQRVQIVHPDGSTLTAQRAAVNFEVEEVPAGKTLASPSEANALAGVLDDLRLEDVQSAASFDAGEAQPVTTTFTTSEGLVVEVKAYKTGETYHAALATRVEPPVVTDEPAAPAAGEEDAALDADTAPSAEQRAAMLTVAMNGQSADINARTDGWVYKIPLFKYEQLTHKVEDLLAEQE